MSNNAQNIGKPREPVAPLGSLAARADHQTDMLADDWLILDEV